MSSVDKKIDLTDKEALVLAMAWRCFKTTPEIDFDKLAQLTGYTNPKSVKNLIHAVKKRTADGDESPNAPAKPTPKAKATPTSRKRKVTHNDEGDSSDPVASTPSKRVRGMKRTLSKETVDEDDSESDKKDITKGEDIDVKETGEGIVD
ncbi:hypothetical protein Daesc_001318 [Daldinia eschscholtzii]|uniref:Uncharacterized protein n=1 Tax=Daldinia eschscholtzii TaxID=292717 RepID=A0AAX6MTS4_9PEZI